MPPVDPLPTVSTMSLATDNNGYSVLQFNSASSFKTTPDNSNSYSTINPAGTYKILYKKMTGISLTTELAKKPTQEKRLVGNSYFKIVPTLTRNPQ